MPGKSDLGSGVKVEGFDEMQAALNTFKTKGADKAIRKSLRAGARMMQAAIVESALSNLTRSPRRSPKTTALPLGDIAQSIKISNIKRVNGEGAYTVSIGPKGYRQQQVAMDVEYGHDHRRTRVKLMGQNMRVLSNRATPAHPFLRPAWEATQEEAGALIIETLEAEVTKALESNGDAGDDSSAEEAA